MTRRTAPCLRWLTLISLGAPLAAQTPAAVPVRTKYFDVPINIEMPAPPVLFRGDDGQLHLGYQLLITNWGDADLVLDRVEFIDGDRGRVFASYDTTMLRRVAVFATNVPDAPALATLRHLGAGRTGIFRPWLTVSDTAVPRHVIHRFVFAGTAAIQIARTMMDTNAAPITTSLPLAIAREPAIVISPPLGGGPWKAGGAGGPRSYHLFAGSIDGKIRIAERFAVDFQKIDSAGNILPNPFPYDINNAMFYSNRSPVYAVGDGEVAFVHDGIPENKPTPSGDENMPVPFSRETGAGNQISIKLREGVYAQYAHIAPGTIRVKVGDRVRRGQVIGLIGNSGNAKNPHLHFEVADGPEINSSQGLPWVMDGFDLYGHLGPAGIPDVKAAPVHHRNEMIMMDAILRFPVSR